MTEAHNFFTEEEKNEIIATVVQKKQLYSSGNYCPFYPTGNLPKDCKNKHCREIFPGCYPRCPCASPKYKNTAVKDKFWKAMELNTKSTEFAVCAKQTLALLIGKPISPTWKRILIVILALKKRCQKRLSRLLLLNYGDLSEKDSHVIIAFIFCGIYLVLTILVGVMLGG